MGPTKIFATIALFASIVSSGGARADVIFSFLPTDTFSGDAPAGTLTADFSNVAGGVQLVITSNLGPGENLDPNKALYFNLNPADNASNLTFMLTANTGFSQAASVMTGTDAFKPDGDGLMDILFTYSSSTKAFTTGESQTYLIAGIPGLTASDFDFTSNCGSGCGTGSHDAAIHVQNTPGGSAFTGATVTSTSVPEPASIALLGAGLLGMAGVRSLRRRTRG